MTQPLPPSGGKQGKPNFVSNKKSGLFIKIRLIKNAPSRSINMNNVFWRFYRFLAKLDHLLFSLSLRPEIKGGGGVNHPVRIGWQSKYLGTDRVNNLLQITISIKI